VSDALIDVARRVAGAARDGEQVEAYVVRSRECEVKVHDGGVESLSVAETSGIGVRVVADRRQGIAWARSLDADVVSETLAEARDNATFGQPDDAYGLATPADLAGASPVTLDLWRESQLSATTDAKVDHALELERATKAADSRVRGLESAGYGDSATEAAIATSLGVEAETRRTTCSLGAVALVGDESDTQTGYGFSVGRSIDDLDLGHAASEAASRATRMLGAAPVASRRVAVVLDPLVARSVLALVGSALGGEAMLKGRSMFAGREGEEVAASGVTLVDDPTIPEALGASTHDGEGVPTRRTELIRAGRLCGFLHNVYTARRAGTKTTGSATRGLGSAPGVGARALHLLPGTATPEQIMAAAGEALYVQSVSGLHSGTNPVSGDFSVGAEGLMVRDGAFAEPVREVTIASTLQRILQDVLAVGADLTWLPGGGAGMTLLVADMTLSGS
jgi:PmbA protein